MATERDVTLTHNRRLYLKKSVDESVRLSCGGGLGWRKSLSFEVFRLGLLVLLIGGA
jgi:hypothetical protein